MYFYEDDPFEMFHDVNINGQTYSQLNLDYYSRMEPVYNYGKSIRDGIARYIQYLQKTPETHEAAFKILPIFMDGTGHEGLLNAIDDCDNFLRANESRIKKETWDWNHLLFYLLELKRYLLYLRRRAQKEEEKRQREELYQAYRDMRRNVEYDHRDRYLSNEEINRILVMNELITPEQLEMFREMYGGDTFDLNMVDPEIEERDWLAEQERIRRMVEQGSMSSMSFAR